MPKIIDNLESKLISEAQRQISESGYSAMTIRSVAKACGVGVGTVYNYFPSKEALLATYLLADWKQCVAEIVAISEEAHGPEPVLQAVYDRLLMFTQRHQTIFCDEAAASAFSGSIGRYHAVLRSQLAAPLRRFCSSDFSAEFIAESMLVWTLAGKRFDEIYEMIQKLF